MAICVYHLLLIVSIGICFPSKVQTAVYKIDFVVQQINTETNPILVDLDDNVDKDYRGYVSWDYKDGITFNIGRVADTGPGDIDTKVINPLDGSPIGNAFPSGSIATYTNSNNNYRRINVNLEGSTEGAERIGAFYAEAVHDDNDNIQITTIIRPKAATVKSSADTITASIGDTVDLLVTHTGILEDDLRWRHNGGDLINEWQGMATVTITNVRKADAGIYECHQQGARGQGKHAIMRLIVRACPKGIYGTDCSQDCKTCYNGGMCEDETGICVCPTGFEGEQCETPCGNNWFGATCSIKCSSNPPYCGEKVFCVPDPVGCFCTAGFMGDECKSECSGLSYGANCDLTCHCGAADCDNVRGCPASATCDDGYGGFGCQDHTGTTCQEEGYFGDLCDLQCHCKNYNTCAKSTGVCNDNKCVDGWGGYDCQHALPQLYEFKPTVEAGGSSLKIQWDAWDPNIDYGTGPVEKYNIYLGPQGGPLEWKAESTDTEEEISSLVHETTYEFAVTVSSFIGRSFEGILGPKATARTVCGVPSLAPTISNVIVEGPKSIRLEWETPAEGDWIKCQSGIAAFIVTYGTDNSKRVDGSTATDTVIDNLAPCTEYQFAIQVANKDNFGIKSDPETATTAPKKVSNLSIAPSPLSLNVNWNQPSECTVTNYIVSHQPTLIEQCLPGQGPPVNETTTATSLSIGDLTAYSTYKIIVTATYNGVLGEAEMSNERTTEKAPTGPPSNVNHTVHHEDPIITYNWLQPDCGLRGGVITKYEYAFGLDIEGGDVQYGSTDPDNPMVVFHNLDYYNEYEFQVRAVTSPGDGPYSETTKATTPESYPGAPPIYIGSDDDGIKGYLCFTWEPPPEDDRNGVIILYEYELDIKSNAKLTHWFRNGSTPDIFAIFEGLTHYTEFLFRVRARTSVGPGPFSQHVIARTLPAEPTAPLDLRIVKNFTTQIELQWKRPEDTNGILTSYIITGRSGDDVEKTEIRNNLDLDLVVDYFTDLKSGREYTITVSGVTSGGQGPGSNEAVGGTLKSELNGSNDTGLIAGFSATIGILLVLLALALVYIFFGLRKQRTLNTQRELREESSNNTTAKQRDSSAVALSPEGYVRYIPPANISGSDEYQELTDQSASNDTNLKTQHAYANTMMKGDGMGGMNDKNNYEEMPHDGNDDNEAYAAVC